MDAFRAPAWLPGGQAQTIYAALAAPRPRIAYRRERWDTPDGDFIDLDWTSPEDRGLRIEDRGPGFGIQDRGLRIEDRGRGLGIQEPASAPLVVLFHGLEGSSRSHYALALMQEARSRGWRGVVVHFRGCSGESNRLPRAYHSGDSAEIDWILQRLKHGASAPLFAVGVSLGGNALLKWLGEQADAATAVVAGACAISAPVDLMAAGDALGRGFNLLYAQYFLASMKRKSLAKLERFPGVYDRRRMLAARTLREFDEVVTAPLHGFRDTDDYWTRASSKPLLGNIAVPTLMINALNDPFLPGDALPRPHEVSRHVILDLPAAGGHAGFISGAFPGNLDWLPRRVLEFFGASAEK